jgi:hypothetical protein
MNYEGNSLVRSTKEWWEDSKKTRRYRAHSEPEDVRWPGKTRAEVHAWFDEHHGRHWIDLRADEFLFEIRILVERATEKVAPLHGLALRRARLNPTHHPSTLI